jgi:hypothetical protein
MMKKNLMPSLWKGTSVPVKEGDSDAIAGDKLSRYRY